MPNVTFTFNSGREKSMGEKFARTLQRMGKGTYLTRDMRAARGDDLDGMSLEALRALADARGVKVHHRAGAEKVRQALREAGK